MSSHRRLGVVFAATFAVLASRLQAAESVTPPSPSRPSVAPASVAPADQQIDVLRNTLVNILQTLVDKGLLTRAQADQIVKQAQNKAAADAAAATAKSAAQAQQEQGAVRVPYVPQFIQDEIAKKVAQQVKPAVTASVVQQAKTEGWGIPGALPDWLRQVRVFGDVTVREQSDIFAKDNQPYTILDFNAINQYGGFSKVPGVSAFLDTTGNRNRLRERARFGVQADVTPRISAFIRLASGSLTDPGSESQTFGTYAERWTVGFDQAYLLMQSSPAPHLSAATLELGRTPDPWFAPTELVYARDLSFEGASGTLRWGWGAGGDNRSHVYLTAGGFPMLEIPLVNQENKWLVGGQAGVNLRLGDRQFLRTGFAYYDFLHVTGIFNPEYSTYYNFTAPAFERTGNTMFDIANQPTDPTVQLWALAAQFRIADIAATYELDFPRYTLSISGEAVRNIGYDRQQIEALSGQTFDSPEDKGYVGEISFGDPLLGTLQPLQWRLALGYRYVQPDAVLDAWTDADFHEGGTNAKGYYFWGTLVVAKNTWLRLRYLSGNEIVGPRYGLDIVQFDVNTRF
jgi:hypothetical protein